MAVDCCDIGLTLVTPSLRVLPGVLTGLGLLRADGVLVVELGFELELDPPCRAPSTAEVA